MCLTNICDENIDCSDGSDENNCGKIFYKIGKEDEFSVISEGILGTGAAILHWKPFSNKRLMYEIILFEQYYFIYTVILKK